MLKVRFASLMLLGIVAAGANFHTLASQEMAEKFTREMFASFKAPPSDCPADMPNPGPYRTAICARLAMNDKEFKRTWDRLAKQRSHAPYFALERGGWTKNEKGFEKLYEADGTPLKVFWDDESSYLIVSYVNDIASCADYPEAAKEFAFERESKNETPAKEITPPTLIMGTRASPLYPLKAIKARKESRVVLGVVIKQDGTVGEICLLSVEAPGYGFEQAALIAVRKWRYSPALLDGKPVQVWFTETVIFSLRRQDSYLIPERHSIPFPWTPEKL